MRIIFPGTIVTLMIALTFTAPASGASYGPHIADAAIPLTQIRADHAVDVLRRTFGHDDFVADTKANAVIVRANADHMDEIRAVIAGIDVRDPAAQSVNVVRLTNAEPKKMAALLSPLYRNARITPGPNTTLLIRSTSADLSSIQNLLTTLDAAPIAAPPVPRTIDAVRIDYVSAKEIAHRVADTTRRLRVAVAGSSVILDGEPDDVDRAKRLITALDHPRAEVAMPVLYHPHAYAADSIADLLRRTFPTARIEVEAATNSLSVTAPVGLQHTIADAIAQLDADSAPSGSPGGGGSSLTIYQLKAALPGSNGTPSSTAADLAATVLQALSSIAPDLRITAVPNTEKLILAGSPYSIASARRLLEELDTAEDLVVLDTQIFEVDETDARDLGLSLPNPVISTTFSEVAPVADANGNVPRLARLQPIQRTPLSLGAQLSLLVQHGKAKVLANPRITTVSGRTATIHAGDTISVQTTAGGGAGTVATTQLQTFQTGVSLDITPVVNADGFVTVTLHPTVNSEIGFLNGIPQIATRDTQTTVALHEDQTLAIGGLIQESDSSTVTKIPLLGSLPVVGRLFQDHQSNTSRNELVVTVTPHIIRAQSHARDVGMLGLPALPAGETIAPGYTEPSVLAELPASAPLAPSAPTAYRPGPPSLPSVATPQQLQPPPGAPTPQGGQSPLPLPLSGLPSNVASVNRYVWGTPPQNNFAKPGDPLQIFYITFAPTVARANDELTFNVVSTTNTQQMSVMLGSAGKPLLMISPGQWQGSLTLGALSAQLPTAPANLTLNIVASKSGGAVATVPVPISLTP